jgi:hypothetical protein
LPLKARRIRARPWSISGAPSCLAVCRVRPLRCVCCFRSPAYDLPPGGWPGCAAFLRAPLWRLSKARPARALGLAPGFIKVSTGSGTEIPCAFRTSGSMRIAAFELRSQVCQEETFRAYAIMLGYRRLGSGIVQKAVSNSHEGAVSPSTQTGRPPSLVPAETSRMSALPARRPRRGPARADPSCARCFAQDRARVHMYSARFRRTPYSASGFVVPSPTLSTMAATARSRRFGNRARSAAAWAAGISSRVRSVQ